jgi:hypothetical protein
MSGELLLVLIVAAVIGRTINSIWPWNDIRKPPPRGALISILIVLGTLGSCVAVRRC